MRGCERGAGSADRAPAPAQPSTSHGGLTIPNHRRQAISSHRGQAISCHSKQTISSHNRQPISNYSQATSNHGVQAISRHREKAIKPQIQKQETVLPRRHYEAIRPRRRRQQATGAVVPRRLCTEPIVGRGEDATLRHGGEAILPRRTRGGAILLCVLLLLSLRGSRGSASLGAQLVCARAPLTEKQRALCRASPAAMAAIAAGLRMAYEECREQLAGRRWNCSGVGDGAHFGHVMPLGQDAGGCVHVRHHVGGSDARAERGVRARRPARLRLHAQAARRRRGRVRAVGVGRRRRGAVRRGGVRSAARAPLPGRARAGARRAGRHEPAQQQAREKDGEGAGAARVQVPRRVGLLRRAHVLARAAALPRARRRPARQVPARQDGERSGTRHDGGRSSRHTVSREEAAAGRRPRGAQERAGVPGAVADVLRARAGRRRAGHARPPLQQHLQGRGRVREPVLRARVQHGAAHGARAVSLPLPVVLPRALRHLPRAERAPRVQLTPRMRPTSCTSLAAPHRLLAARGVAARDVTPCACEKTDRVTVVFLREIDIHM